MKFCRDYYLYAVNVMSRGPICPPVLNNLIQQNLTGLILLLKNSESNPKEVIVLNLHHAGVRIVGKCIWTLTCVNSHRFHIVEGGCKVAGLRSSDVTWFHACYNYVTAELTLNFSDFWRNFMGSQFRNKSIDAWWRQKKMNWDLHKYRNNSWFSTWIRVLLLQGYKEEHSTLRTLNS